METLRHELCSNAFYNTIDEYVEGQDRNLINKAIGYGVKMINTERVPEVRTGEYLHSRYEVMRFIKACISTLTLKEFMN